MCAHVVMVPQIVIEEILKEIERQNLARVTGEWPARVQPAPPSSPQPDRQLNIQLSLDLDSNLDPTSNPTPNQTLNPVPNTALDPKTIKSAFPKSELPIIVPDAEAHLTTKVMTWGYHVSWSKQVVFNTRFDTATKPGRNMWAESLAERRCVVPTYGFYEPHKSETLINLRTNKINKQQYFFTSPTSAILFIAGVFEGDQFSLMTTEPNSVMLPIHNRMPVVLEPNELDTWLFGEYLSLEDRSMVSIIATKKGT